MQRYASDSFRFHYLPCLVLALALSSTAQGRPHQGGINFGGEYRVLHLTEQGDSVELEVSLRVINYSGADVQGATIRLASSLAQPVPPELQSAPDWEKQQPRFKNVQLNFNEHKIVPPLVGRFNIPAQEFERWTHGGPNFIISYRDGSGTRRNERISLAPAPGSLALTQSPGEGNY